MLKKTLFILCTAFLLTGTLPAQRAWWVFFTDKNGCTFDPHAYFAQEAIDRRVKLGLSLYDSTDFPVNARYVAEVAKCVGVVGHTTRWFNGVGVEATEEQVAAVRKLPFVREVVPQAQYEWKTACVPDTTVEDYYGEERKVSRQIDPLQGKRFEESGKKGNGIVIAVLDAGFRGVDDHPAFQHIRFNNRIRATFDFVEDDADVYAPGGDHGTMVLSCIGGIVNGTQMGLAPDATFLLARISKQTSWKFKGEENFLAAIEWADKLGAMIINCSDGPTTHDYFPEQLDGKAALVTRSANLAARKGILVVVAGGNEGGNSEHHFLPPADADSALTVTAINDKGYIAEYSSFGPMPGFRRKPDVCAPGTAVVANADGEYEVEEGTSISAPLLVGFAACLFEMHPDLSAMQLADTMRRSASLYPYFDYAHGYGAPQAGFFFGQPRALQKTFAIESKDEHVQVTIDPSQLPSLRSDSLSLLFYSLEDEKGRIYKYEVIDLQHKDFFRISVADLRKGIRIHVSYKGYYESYQL